MLLCITQFIQAHNAQSTTPTQRPASSPDEIVVILNPAVSSQGLAYLASKTIPVQYRTKTGESLAAIAKQRYGVAARFRASLRELNATLAAQLARKGEDLMWAKLPEDTTSNSWRNNSIRMSDRKHWHLSRRRTRGTWAQRI
jgi:CRISPR/Cas system-associated endonuclease Cas1